MDAAEFNELIAKLVRDDDARLSPGDISQAAGLAINRYSKDRPRRILEDCEVLEGLVFETPEFWEIGRSSIIDIEAPIGRNPPSFVSEDYCYVYDLPDGSVEFRLLAAVVPVGGLCRVRYTASHLNASTILEGDHEVVAALAASLCCDQLSSLYGHDSDSTMHADTVRHETKTITFAKRARDYRARYDGVFGKGSVSGAAGTIVQQAPRPGRMFK